MRCVGFVANVYNSLNYDIDILGVTKETIFSKYGFILHNTYTHKSNGKTETGTSYRCRLSGVLKKHVINQQSYNSSIREIVMTINRLNGWVIVYIHGVDKYQRLVVSLSDPITSEPLVNILKKSPDVYMPYIVNKSNRLSPPPGFEPRYG
jgi:hypothetical protein